MKKRWTLKEHKKEIIEESDTLKNESTISEEAFNYNFIHELVPQADAINLWNEVNAIKVFAPTPDNIAMDFDSTQTMKGVFANVNPFVLNYFITGSSFIGYQAMMIMAQHWLINKGCFQKARDSIKSSYEITSNGEPLGLDDLNKIDKIDKELSIKQQAVNATGFNNIYGIRHVLFLHKDPNFDYSKPFNPDSFSNGNYAGISQIDPYWFIPIIDANDLINPASPSFYEPEMWSIRGRKYHKSHFVILRGEPVADMLKPSYRYGGISLVQRVYEKVYSAERTLNEAPQLVLTKRLNTRKVDMTKVMSNSNKAMNYLEHCNQFRDNHGTLIYDKAEEIGQLDTSLSDLDDVIMNQYIVVNAILDYPISKLMGNGHSGFSTGETDENYYIASCQTVQENYLTPVLEAHYLRLSHSLFGEDKKINVVWNPMKIESDKEKAETNFIKSQTANNYYTLGAVDNYEVREQLIADKHSGFNGLEMPPNFEERVKEDCDNLSDD